MNRQQRCGISTYIKGKAASGGLQKEAAMKRIFVDLEMHPIERHHRDKRRICATETIEIGAVMLDENNREISSFCEYVRPAYTSTIYPQYEQLTGISYDMVESAGSFEEVLGRFLDWCGEDCCIYSWSENDLIQIRQEAQLKGIPVTGALARLLSHWVDYQQEFDDLLGITRSMSLKEAVRLGGLDFDGRAHDGLIDARNTGNLFRSLQDENTVRRLRGSVSVSDEPLEFSLGDIFNFGELVFA